jgi:hypothetical protein
MVSSKEASEQELVRIEKKINEVIKSISGLE